MSLAVSTQLLQDTCCPYTNHQHCFCWQSANKENLFVIQDRLVCGSLINSTECQIMYKNRASSRGKWNLYGYVWALVVTDLFIFCTSVTAECIALLWIIDVLNIYINVFGFLICTHSVGMAPRHCQCSSTVNAWSEAYSIKSVVFDGSGPSKRKVW